MTVESANSTLARNVTQAHPIFWVRQSKTVLRVDDD